MRKGFTLIELLAVIVILAIIALIATPIILDIIGGTKEETTLESGELYLHAVENAIATENLSREFNPVTCEVTEDGNLNCDGGKLIIETNGERPSGGYIELEEGKIIYVEELLLGEYKLETNEDLKLVIGKLKAESECILDYETTVANRPNLMGNTLVPVKYDGDNWVITTSSDSNWYNYRKQEWANAVILNDGVSTSAGTLIYPDGDKKNIKAMLVWIPRYEYRIEDKYGKCGTNAKNPGAIDIKFVESSKTKADENYIIHPAFTFGDTQLSGIWVGKFETSHTNGTAILTCTDEECGEADSLRILPNVVSLRSNPVSKFFYLSRSMTREGNAFKLDSTKTDSHMMKNSEWGAVAYLTQSKYGKYGNSDYQDANKEVYKNNSNNYYTGRSGGAPGGSITKLNVQYPEQSTSTSEYNNYGYYTYEGYEISYDGTITGEKDISKGTGASTTGNITGVYDMSGGAYEYVMGYYEHGATTWGARTSSGTETDYAKFTSKPEAKYFDAYTTTSATTACSGGACTGHALGETSGWYGDYASFVSSSSPWFIRGGNYGSSSSAGVFNFYYNVGDSGGDGSFRVVFAPTT